MILIIDQKTPVPPYEQIRLQVISLVASGALQAGDRLPSIRQLAGDLGLASGTVMRAIRELENEGWLVTRGHRGTYVTDRKPDVAGDGQEELQGTALAFVQTALRMGFDRGAIIDAVDRAFVKTAPESAAHS